MCKCDLSLRASHGWSVPQKEKAYLDAPRHLYAGQTVVFLQGSFFPVSPSFVHSQHQATQHEELIGSRQQKLLIFSRAMDSAKAIVHLYDRRTLIPTEDF